MTDIRDKDDIARLVKHFYASIADDEEIGYFFTEVVPLNWDYHIPRMVSFWSSVLLDTGEYKGNPIAQHIAIHRKSTLSKAHFDHWLERWRNTVQSLYQGPIADLAITKATMMAELMQFKIKASDSPGHIQ